MIEGKQDVRQGPIRLAISWVSKVPAAPDDDAGDHQGRVARDVAPKPTASPVKALKSEMTTGMSAPPMAG